MAASCDTYSVMYRYRWDSIKAHVKLGNAVTISSTVLMMMMMMQLSNGQTTLTTTTPAATTATTAATSSSNELDNQNPAAFKTNLSSSSPSASSPLFPAFFIFGDSLVDVGNNNYIISVAKANQLPFGIDFPAGPTGRFSNGKTVLDEVAEIIKLPYPPPYLNPSTKGKAILKGVNFASGAGGYLQSSGFNFIGRVDFDTQIQWFSSTAEQLKSELGAEKAKKLLAEALFITVFGSNDYVNNYLLSYSPVNKVFTPPQFRDVILQKIAAQITEMYKLGARKIVVAGVGPIGCIPSQLVRQRSVNGECSDYVNAMARDFNQGLESIIAELKERLGGAHILYADTYTPVMDIVNHPHKYGFKYVSEACCGAGKYKGQLLCIPILKACEDRKDYVFWDAFHPTEATNMFLGRSLFSIVTPIISNP